MHITLQRKDTAFLLEASSGKNQVLLDAAAAIGGSENGFRPMELFLASLASCSSIDILSILYKQKQEIENYQVDVEGIRAETTPAIFTQITLHLLLKGNIEPDKVERAIHLTQSKYCSVIQMLNAETKVLFQYTIAP